MSEKLVDTGKKCVCCGRNVFARVVKVVDEPIHCAIIGQKSPHHLEIIEFHCSNINCGLAYAFPPGDPLATDRILKAEMEVDEDEIAKALRQQVEDLGLEIVKNKT